MPVARFRRYLLWGLAVAVAAVAASEPMRADSVGELNLLLAGGNPAGPDIRVDAQFTAPTPERPPLLVVTADIPEPFHVYAVDQAPGGPRETRIKVVAKDTVQIDGAFAASPPPESHVDTVIWEGLELREHRGRVTWYAPLRIAETENLESLTISGAVELQACDPSRCIPMEIPFQARLGPGQGLPADLELPTASAATPPISAPPMDDSTGSAGPAPADPATDPADRLQIENGPAGQDRSLATMLMFGFLGGLILNLMPCVLPVIGLKLMSFVEQAGHSRSRALLLNLYYALGIVSVFLVLAALAVVAGLGWGTQFASDGFNITLAAVVFAMGLSLLGVWEIPIPGLFGGRTASSMAQKEGPLGAVLKGMITTVLATPCAGPFVGTALAWAVRQSGVVTFTVFGAMGVGMASPYLLIGAFPSLIRWLPRPGDWMITFKQVMGFVLLGTVVYLMTFIHPGLIVPTVALLVGVGVACWWISRTPATSEPSRRLAAWVTAGLVIVLSGVVAFSWLRPITQSRLSKYVVAGGMEAAHADSNGGIAWQPFSPDRLERLAAQGQTVIVDFTADWCPTCKWLEKFVLDTPEVLEVIQANRVVPLVADYTRRPPDVEQMLKQLDSISVPVLAVFPAESPTRPIVFRDTYSQQDLIDALRRAGPSRATMAADSAMRIE